MSQSTTSSEQRMLCFQRESAKCSLNGAYVKKVTSCVYCAAGQLHGTEASSKRCISSAHYSDFQLCQMHTYINPTWTNVTLQKYAYLNLSFKSLYSAPKHKCSSIGMGFNAHMLHVQIAGWLLFTCGECAHCALSVQSPSCYRRDRVLIM